MTDGHTGGQTDIQVDGQTDRTAISSRLARD